MPSPSCAPPCLHPTWSSSLLLVSPSTSPFWERYEAHMRKLVGTVEKPHPGDKYPIVLVWIHPVTLEKIYPDAYINNHSLFIEDWDVTHSIAFPLPRSRIHRAFPVMYRRRSNTHLLAAPTPFGFAPIIRRVSASSPSNSGRCSPGLTTRCAQRGWYRCS